MADERLRRLMPGSAAQIAERLRSAETPCRVCGGRLRVWADSGNTGRTMWFGDGPCPRCQMKVRPCLCGRDARNCDACLGLGVHFRPRVELAAFCGSPSARDAIRGRCPSYCTRPTHSSNNPECPRGRHHHADERCVEDVPIKVADKIDKLRSWGVEVTARTLVAAARLALLREPNRNDGAEVVEAAEAWLELQTPQCERAWAVEWGKRQRSTTAEWLPHPPRVWISPQKSVHVGAMAPVSAVCLLLGADPVWDAISQHLIEWALR